jgi:tetratricopeptide (TPR) repeat protein
MASTLTDFASDLPRAKQIAEEGLEMARRAGGTGWIAWIEGTLGGIELMRGDLEAAEAWTGASLQDAILAGDQPLAGTRHLDLALLLVLRGDPAAAAEELALAAAFLEEQPEPQITPTLRRIEAALAGEEEEAVRYLWQAADDLARFSVDQDPRAIVELVRLLVRRGERGEARRARDLLAAGASPFSRASLQVADGLLSEDPADAVRALREAAERLDALGTRIDLGLALLDLGRAERRAGEDPAATFDRARTLFAECGAARFLPEADAERSR